MYEFPNIEIKYNKEGNPGFGPIGSNAFICTWAGNIENAEFIVRACNAHDDLLAELEFLAGHAKMAKGLHAPSMQASLENIEKRANAALAKAGVQS